MLICWLAFVDVFILVIPVRTVSWRVSSCAKWMSHEDTASVATMAFNIGGGKKKTLHISQKYKRARNFSAIFHVVLMRNPM